MNIYQSIGSHLGTSEASELAERLSAWHDAMVAHERVAKQKAACHDDCPHTDAGLLWEAAVQTFGDRAGELRFLRSRGESTHPVVRRGPRPPVEVRA